MNLKRALSPRALPRKRVILRYRSSPAIFKLVPVAVMTQAATIVDTDYV